MSTVTLEECISKSQEERAYNKGLEDMYELLAHIQSDELSIEQIANIWHMSKLDFNNKFTIHQTPQEAIEIFKKWNKEKEEIYAGDVVTVGGGDVTFICTKDNASGDYTKCHLLASDGSVWEDCDKNGLKKTGKKIDISSLLEQIK